MTTDEQRQAQVQELSHAFVDLALQRNPQPPHSVILEALLTTYIAVAKTHRCCTHTAAMAALQAAERLVVGTHSGITAAPSPIDRVH
jgi:hypothetical protein